jgi:hypothetical protein
MAKDPTASVQMQITTWYPAIVVAERMNPSREIESKGRQEMFLKTR